jgi:hypothetical protein
MFVIMKYYAEWLSVDAGGRARNGPAVPVGKGTRSRRPSAHRSDRPARTYARARVRTPSQVRGRLGGRPPARRRHPRPGRRGACPGGGVALRDPATAPVTNAWPFGGQHIQCIEITAMCHVKRELLQRDVSSLGKVPEPVWRASAHPVILGRGACFLDNCWSKIPKSVDNIETKKVVQSLLVGHPLLPPPFFAARWATRGNVPWAWYLTGFVDHEIRKIVCFLNTCSEISRSLLKPKTGTTAKD